MPIKHTQNVCLFLVALSAVGLGVARRAAAQAAPVVVAPIIERDITVGQTFVGTVEPTQRSIVGSAVDGRVVRVPVEEGDFVGFVERPGAAVTSTDDEAIDPETIGQPLAELRTGTIDIMIDGAKAELVLRQHELAEMKAGTRPKELEQRQAELDRALALRDYAKKRHDRLESLDRATTREEVEQAYSAWIASEQNLKAAEAAVSLAQEGPRKEQKDQAAARLQMQAEQVALLEDRRKKYTIRAPFDGYVIAKHTEVGAWIQTGDPVAEVICIDPVQVTVAVPESYISRVSRGSDVTVRFDGLGEKLFRGQVFRVVPQADVRSRTFPVTVRLDNPRGPGGDHVIKVGMLAHATIGQRHRAVLVPKDALVLGGPKPIVYATTGAVQAGQEAKVRPVTVEIGVAFGDLAQVTGDLRPGQAVVVEGNERLRGDMIRVTKLLPPSVTD
ncbi:MAG: efflux RND transporter periplasmic adaptor subunit [Pirellulaceae bacterium]